MGLQKTESVEAGLALSKLVSKLEAGNRILDKSGSFADGPVLDQEHELRVSKASIDTSIDNLKRIYKSVRR